MKKAKKPNGWIPIPNPPDMLCPICGVKWDNAASRWNYCPCCGTDMRERIPLPEGKNVYKLTAYNDPKPVYIATDKSKDQIADLFAGFWFFFVRETACGEDVLISLDMTVALLCGVCGCMAVDKRIPRLHPDLLMDQINLWDERDRRMLTPEPYIEKVLPYTDTPLVNQIRAYFNSDTAHNQLLSSEVMRLCDIMKLY